MCPSVVSLFYVYHYLCRPKSALSSCNVWNFTDTVCMIVPFVTRQPSALQKPKAALISPSWWSCQTKLLLSLPPPCPRLTFLSFPLCFVFYILCLFPLHHHHHFSSSILHFLCASSPSLPPCDHLWGVEEKENKFNVQSYIMPWLACQASILWSCCVHLAAVELIIANGSCWKEY